MYGRYYKRVGGRSYEGNNRGKKTRESSTGPSIGVEDMFTIFYQDVSGDENVENFMESLAFAAYHYLTDSLPLLTGWTLVSNTKVTYDLEPILPDAQMCEDAFLLHEPSCVFDDVPDMLFGRGTEHYFRNLGIQHAYLDCVQSVPRLNDNNVSNILEVTKFITDLVVHHRIEIPKSLSSAWLQYRYQYGTAKLDAEEAVEFVHRHMDLRGISSIKCYGRHTIRYKGRDILFRCCLNATPKQLPTLKRVWRSLYQYGLTPSFYTVWDMIPYSFIVDWFLPIGDVMSAWDAEREYTQSFDLENINFSISYSNADLDKGLTFGCYTRWYASTPPTLQGRYFLEDGRPSSPLNGHRVLDLASLILK
jgi:hypothetical protein